MWRLRHNTGKMRTTIRHAPVLASASVAAIIAMVVAAAQADQKNVIHTHHDGVTNDLLTGAGASVRLAASFFSS